MADREIRLGKKPPRKCGEKAHRSHATRKTAFLMETQNSGLSRIPVDAAEQPTEMSAASRLPSICRTI